MSCIHSLDHINSLTSADLADNDPVRAHAERGADQVPDADRAAALDIGVARLEAHQVLDLPDLQLGIIFDGDHAFPFRYVRGEGIQKRRLAGACPPADENVVSGAHHAVQKCGDLL